MGNEKQNHVNDEIPAYTLGILDSSHVRHIERHMRTCAHCRQELDAYRDTLAKIDASAPQHTPHPRVKRAVMSAIRSEAQPINTYAKFIRWFAGYPAFSITGTALVLALLIANLVLIRQNNDLSRMRRHGYDSVLLSPSAAASESTGMVVYTRDGKSGFLVVNHLAMLPENQQYQLWLINGTQRTSGGVFSVPADGYYVMEIEANQLLTNFDSFGITIEPAGGSPGPTGEKVLGGSF